MSVPLSFDMRPSSSPEPEASQPTFEERKNELRTNKQRDVFSAACVVYYMLSGGRFPFDTASEEER
jgi:hypothetical protein